MSRIIIGALQDSRDAARFALCRATWMKDARRLGVEALFLLGAGGQNGRQTAHEGDLLILPCPNTYPALPQRTRLFCRWALDSGGEWDYLLKCDSDTWVHVPRLLAYDTAGREYIGAEWKPGVGYASGGAGYLLSRKAAAIVAEKMTHTTGAEDLIVGQILRQNGIPFSIEPRFVPFGSMERRPKRTNDLITTHKVGADVFHVCQREFEAEQ